MMEFTVNYKDISNLEVFPDSSSLVKQFAEWFLKRIRETSIDKKEIHIALSGGSTPSALYKYLSNNADLLPDLNHVHFYWGDERCVPPDSKESNFGTAHSEFLKNFNIPDENIHRVKGELTPEFALKEYALDIEAIPLSKGLPEFDLIILGIGNDGHTASIFPDKMEFLNSPEKLVIAIHPKTGQKRISLTGLVINNAKEVAFLASGGSKSAIISAIYNDEIKAREYPAYFIRPAKGKLYWFIDKDAAESIV